MKFDSVIRLITAEYLKDDQWNTVETVYFHDHGFTVPLQSGLVLVAGGHEKDLGIGQIFSVEQHTSVSQAAKLTRAEQELFVRMLNQEAGRPYFALPTRGEIELAHQKIGLHGDLSQLNTVSSGCFWIKISKKMFKELTGE